MARTKSTPQKSSEKKSGARLKTKTSTKRRRGEVFNAKRSLQLGNQKKDARLSSKKAKQAKQRKSKLILSDIFENLKVSAQDVDPELRSVTTEYALSRRLIVDFGSVIMSVKVITCPWYSS